MHQHPRPSPRSASSASNASTNPERTNNPRERPLQLNRSSVDLTSYTERAGADTGDSSRRSSTATWEEKEATKLNQIVQHFHCKAALTICSARASLPQVYTRNGDIKQNRWFNVVLDDTDVLLEDLVPWRRSDLSVDKPAPLVIEVYLDTSHLSHKQALVLSDEYGRRWPVSDALASSADSSPRPVHNGGRRGEVILERWTIDLGDAAQHSPAELNDALPNVYKKGIVLFRALYSFVRFLPAWRLHRRCTRQVGRYQAPRLRFRIRQGHELPEGQQDSLYTPLCPTEKSQEFVDRYRMPPLVCLAGPLSLAVEYRTSCEFNVVDAESLLSSRFMSLDEGHAALPVGRSLPGSRTEQSRMRHNSLIGAMREEIPRMGAYGSLGTFHATEKRASPVTVLKQRVLDEDGDMERARSKGKHILSSTNLVNNPPFKAGSLASSPRASPTQTQLPSSFAPRSEPQSTRMGSISSSKKASLNTLPQHTFRPLPIPNETAISSSGSGSPKPAPVHRYSSSFANRSRRGTASKAGESNVSSGRTSASSKEGIQPPVTAGITNDELASLRGAKGIGLSGGAGAMVSSAEDESIASFISDLERAKDLPSLRSRPASRDNTVNLSKYSILRDPNAQLAEEMSASSFIQTSSTPPSRRLSNVPGLSTSSSPSRVLAYAPHVRSRLSTHSIAEEVTGASGASGEGSEGLNIHQVEEDDEDEEPFIFPQDNLF